MKINVYQTEQNTSKSCEAAGSNAFDGAVALTLQKYFLHRDLSPCIVKSNPCFILISKDTSKVKGDLYDEA